MNIFKLIGSSAYDLIQIRKHFKHEIPKIKIQENDQKRKENMKKEKHMKKVLQDVPYYPQIDNSIFASTSCYPTCMAMAMSFCLKLEGKSKIDVGCPKYSQLEDYITTLTESKEIKYWIKRNWKKYGSWFLKYKPRTLAAVEEHIFNMLMKEHKYKTVFNSNITYQDYCNHIDTGFPVVIHGKFSSISPVDGHIVLGVGYDKSQGAGVLIVHDPWGNALYDKYKTHTKGKFAEYYQYLLMRNWKERKVWGQMIQRI